MHVSLGERQVRFAGQTTARLIGVEHVAATPIDWSSLVAGEVATSRDPAAIAHTMNLSMVGEATYDELLNDMIAIATAEPFDATRFPQAAARLAAMSRLQPGVAENMAKTVRTTESERLALSLTAALGMAGTQEAQGALGDLLGDAEVGRSTRRAASISLATTDNVGADILATLANFPRG